MAPGVRAGIGVRGARWTARAVALLVFALPLAAALPLVVAEAAAAPAWRDLLSDPQLPGAMRGTAFTAVASTLVALALTMALTAAWHDRPAWTRLARALAPLLAVPHAAFAIGLAWLIAPSGAMARLLAPLAGWQVPPAWPTVNDPWGLGLVAVLVAKETPFLLWTLMGQLARPEEAARLAAGSALARTLGYTRAALWWRLWWPLWLPRLAWPLLAVLAYGVSVVDVALVIGPGSPPTLAALAYADLLDADPVRNARGAAAAWLLAVLLALLVALAWLAWGPLRRLWLRAATDGERRAERGGLRVAATAVSGVLIGGYAAVVLALAALSVAGVWTFPALWPQVAGLDAWRQVMAAAGTVGFTAALAAVAAAIAVAVTVAWLEASPPRWDAWATPAVLLPLAVPPLLLMAGLYRGALHLRLDGTLGGLAWGHALVACPYAFLVLRPAWRAFDLRFEHTALALGRSRLAFRWRVKWPLLAAPLAAALAVCFAVSVAQFLATQFLGAGRHATVTTEAVTLASGGQRTLAAAFALLQAALPLAAFALGGVALRRRAPRQA